MSLHTENRHSRNHQRKYATVQSDDGNYIGLHAEPFWYHRPNLWFEKIEAQLSNCNINDDDRKFKYVVSLLDEAAALEVKDVIIEPPDYDKYDALKQQLIRRITDKNELEAKQRMTAEEMGDRKPSEFYRHLRVLAGCYVREDFVDEVWADCLPSQLRSVIECVKDYTDSDTQMKIADRVHEIFISPPSDKQTGAPPTVLMESLMKEMESLNKKIETFKLTDGPRKPRSSCKDLKCDGSPSTPRKKTTINTPQNKPCQYHTKYGVKLCKIPTQK